MKKDDKVLKKVLQWYREGAIDYAEAIDSLYTHCDNIPQTVKTFKNEVKNVERKSA